MTELYDVAAIGNAIVDVIAPSTDAFIAAQGLPPGGMTLIDEARALDLQKAMAKGIETSGGSAANTIAGLASLGGRGAFIGKVADDRLGQVFRLEIQVGGVMYSSAGPLLGGPSTACCLINVTTDGQRTMATYLGAAGLLSAADVDPAIIEAAKITYLEGYLFDPEEARKAFAKAATIARTNNRLMALTLSDSFVVDRHREALLGFIESQVDVLFANEAELTALFQLDFDQSLVAVRKIAKIAAVTRSEKGSVIAEGNQVYTVAAEPVAQVLDTTGAGDQYAAGFCYGLAQGKPLPVCGRLGSIAAAEVISHYGPRPQVRLAALAAEAGL